MNTRWQDSLKTNAKTFYLASLFFPKNILNKVTSFYALCRFIDDSVDKSKDSHKAEKILTDIRKDLFLSEPKFEINKLYIKNHLNPVYVEDLMDGAKFDINPVRIKDVEHLIEYCYQVAGSVGLVMCDIMSVNNKKARPFAVDLGIAMQITNICRDVLEDALTNRVYIPSTLLLKYNSDQNEVLRKSIDRKVLAQVITELISLSDKYYASAKGGFCHIPFRARGSIIIASNMYRQIGIKLLRQGADPLKGRVVVGFFEKLYILFKSIGEWIKSGFEEPTVVQHSPGLHRGLEKFKLTRGFGG